MDALIRTIGPAPAELLPEEFIHTRLRPERDRVERSLSAFRAGAVPTWEKKKAKKKAAKKKAAKKKTTAKRANLAAAKELSSMLSSEGLTMEDLQDLLKGVQK